MKTLHILHLEDNPLDAELACATLEDDGVGCEVTRVQARVAFEAALEDDGFDLILADYSLPGFDGFSALEMARKIRPELPFILVSGAIGEELAVEALKSGATDYVLKHRLERLAPTVRRAMREAQERSERQRAERALRILAETSELLASPLDYRGRLRHLASLVVPGFADWCAVDVLGEDGQLERLVVEHEDPRQIELARKLQERYPPDPDQPYGVPNVLRTGEPEMVSEITEELLDQHARDAEHREILRELGLRSYMVVPMIAQGRTLGTINFVLSSASGRHYDTKDLAVAKTLVRRAALAIDNARLYEETRREIAERERAEEELHKSHALLSAVIEGTSEAIFVKDTRGRYLLANSATASIIGRPAEDILGKDDAELFSPEVARWLIQVDRHVMTTGETVRVEEDVPMEGAIRVFLSTKAVYRDHQGKIVGLIGIATDITERKRAEEALHEVREAERSRIARDLHDVVLQDLMYAMQTLQGSPTSQDGQDAESDEVVAALQRSVRGLRGAIYDLRLQATGEEAFVRSLESLVDLNRRMYPGCAIELKVSEGFPEELPERTGKELLRVVQEALANAQRHSEARHVSVALGSSREGLWVEVSDDGRGFDPAAMPVGLGTKGMRERSRALGGDLEIKSVPGEGTKVRLEVPLQIDGEGSPEGEPEEEIHILLVEDHTAFRQAITSVFERVPGLKIVEQAGSLAEARETLDGREVDIAILDLGLPDGYGGDLIKDLRARNPQAQALVLSASLDRAEIARAVESGAAGVMHKSVDIDEVVEAVRHLRAGKTLMPLEEVVELLRFAGSRREQEREARRAIAKLTPREKEVLQALAKGLDGKEIAKQLNISPVTERNHMASILAKLGVHSRLQALVFALRYSAVDISSAASAPE